MSAPSTTPELATAERRDRQVSFADEPLILVDADDRIVGHLPKAECHAGEGILHRAFSVFLFNEAGEVLMQRRAAGKPLWPLIWSNSCCSHPRRGEQVDDAVDRRLREELGLSSNALFLYKFRYHARYDANGSERELCWVYAGRATGEPEVNPTEIAEWRWMAPEAVDRALATEPEAWSPWCRMEWKRLREEHWEAIEALPDP